MTSLRRSSAMLGPALRASDNQGGVVWMEAMKTEVPQA